MELVKEFVKKRFPSCKMLDYAIAVETVTTSKKDNLILNVDGCVAVCFVDLMRNCGAFSAEEAEDYMKMGVLNGLFVLGRSIGLIAYVLLFHTAPSVSCSLSQVLTPFQSLPGSKET